MYGKQGRKREVLALALALLVPAGARAGPYFGEWGWCWKEAPCCPRGDYHPLHYWLPEVYRLRDLFHPAYLDEYPPGLPVPTGFQEYVFFCRTHPPVPTPPYADPAGFYGREIVPPEGQSTEKKEGTAEKKDAATEKKDAGTQKK
jgi:hypothetical protein